MFIDKDSISVKIEGMNDFLSMGEYLTGARFGYNKLWSKDSGRSLAGTQKGTLLGIYPKIILDFRKLTKSELETLAPILDSANQTVRYYDPYKKAITEMETYTGDYEVNNKGIVNEDRKNNSFSCSFIAVAKRR